MYISCCNVIEGNENDPLGPPGPNGQRKVEILIGGYILFIYIYMKGTVSN